MLEYLKDGDAVFDGIWCQHRRGYDFEDAVEKGDAKSFVCFVCGRGRENFELLLEDGYDERAVAVDVFPDSKERNAAIRN